MVRLARLTQTRESAVTDPEWLSGRRHLLRTAAALGLGGLGGGCGARDSQPTAGAAPASAGGVADASQALAATPSSIAGARSAEAATSFEAATSYNNFYEFGTAKDDPARHAHTLVVRPWTVQVDGEVNKPARLDLDDLLKLAPLEERIYRLRCVEGWSMVIPWIGWSLSALLKRVEPTGKAKYVEFTSLADPKTMPGVASRVLDFPYLEGLRLDEAMHPLTLLAFGMYGRVLPKQNGAPLRLVVPWKYGYKSAKSLVRIRLTETQPRTTWNVLAPEEYGFFSNVNPEVDHPRWSQATERRIGGGGGLKALAEPRKPTLFLNGYADQVGSLYAGMDLRRQF